MPAARKPKLEMYWTAPGTALQQLQAEPVVNWRLKAANGEVLCQCTQGFRDKADAMRNVVAMADALMALPVLNPSLRIVGPGRKPSAT